MRVWEDDEEGLAEDQLERAQRCAGELMGRPPTHAMVKAMLALVESVERDGGTADPVPAPPADARKIFTPKRSAPRKTPPRARPVKKEPQPEELTLW